MLERKAEGSSLKESRREWGRRENTGRRENRVKESGIGDMIVCCRWKKRGVDQG